MDCKLTFYLNVFACVHPSACACTCVLYIATSWYITHQASILYARIIWVDVGIPWCKQNASWTYWTGKLIQIFALCRLLLCLLEIDFHSVNSHHGEWVYTCIDRTWIHVSLQSHKSNKIQLKFLSLYNPCYKTKWHSLGPKFHWIFFTRVLMTKRTHA